jgi:hypothetical protein
MQLRDANAHEHLCAITDIPCKRRSFIKGLT